MRRIVILDLIQNLGAVYGGLSESGFRGLNGFSGLVRCWMHRDPSALWILGQVQNDGRPSGLRIKSAMTVQGRDLAWMGSRFRGE